MNQSKLPVCSTLFGGEPMTKTKRLMARLIALAFCFIIAAPAHAQDAVTPEKKALIKELLGLINASNNPGAIANELMGQLEAGVASQISNDMQGWIQTQKFTPAEQKRVQAQVDETIKRILTRIRAEVPKRINYNEIREKVAIEIYDKHFTEDEVKDLIAFNKTPTAQKFVKLLPQITAEVIPGIDKSTPPEPTQLTGELIEKVALKAYEK